MDWKSNFTILQLTDIHWSTGSNIAGEDTGSMKYITKVINEAKSHAGGSIDLIEVTGDTFMLSTPQAVKKFIEFMESFEIPYAMTWGNHDREGKYNPNWLSKQFLNAAHCVYIEVDNDDVHERCNYVINLKDTNNKVKWQIFHLDSGASYREGATDLGLTYDYIREDQINWLKAEHDKAKTDSNSSNIPSICYYHIAQTDYDTLFNDLLAGGSKVTKSKFFKLEGFAASDYATSMNDCFKANNVVASFIGHAHANDWTCTNTDGIIYGLGVKTGTELYYYPASFGMGKDSKGIGCYGNISSTYTEEFQVVGASLVTLQSTYASSLKLEHLYLNEVEGANDLIIWETY